MRDWSRQDAIAIAGLLIAVIACLASVMLPETRALLGLSRRDEQTAPPPIQPVQQSSTPAPAAEPAFTPTAAIFPASSPPLQESGTSGGEEGIREAQSVTDVDSPRSDETRSEFEARRRNERSGRDQPPQEAFQAEEELRRDAEARARREQPARDQSAQAAFQREQDLREMAARSRDEQTQLDLEPRATTKGLIRFKVKPSDASLYIDGKFIGTPEDVAAGIWIVIGDHSLDIVRPGYKGHKETLTVQGGNPLNVLVELKSY